MLKKISAVLVAVAPASAFAAVPQSVTDGIAAAATDAATIGVAVMGVLIVVAGFMWVRRAIK